MSENKEQKTESDVPSTAIIPPTPLPTQLTPAPPTTPRSQEVTDPVVSKEVDALSSAATKLQEVTKKERDEEQKREAEFKEKTNLGFLQRLPR